jgi:serine/threonine-protein kinase HipA
LIPAKFSVRNGSEDSNPGRRHLIELANEFSINRPGEIIQQVQESIAQWPGIAKECGVSKALIKRIQGRLLQLRD